MTLQVGLVHGDRAFLWADTGLFDMATGDLLGHDTKGFYGTFWPWAGTLSSLGGNAHDIANSISEAWPTDPDSLLAATVDALRIYAAKGYQARVLLATWQTGPQLWIVGTDDCAGEGEFTPCELLHYTNAGNDVPEYHRAVRKGLTPRRMARVIDAQLAAPPVLAAGLPGAAGYRVQYGGNVVELEVSREGVGSRVLRAVDEAA